MCLAIPMQIIRLEGENALCRAKGVEREVSLFLLQGQKLAVGDFVMVHVGYAIQKVEASAADEAWALWRALGEAGDA